MCENVFIAVAAVFLEFAAALAAVALAVAVLAVAVLAADLVAAVHTLPQILYP